MVVRKRLVCGRQGGKAKATLGSRRTIHREPTIETQLACGLALGLVSIRARTTFASAIGACRRDEFLNGRIRGRVHTRGVQAE